MGPGSSLPCVLIRRGKCSLAGAAQWTERRAGNQEVAGLISGQGTGLGCGPGPQLGFPRGNRPMFLFPSFSLPSPLSKKRGNLDTTFTKAEDGKGLTDALRGQERRGSPARTHS